MGVSWSSSTVFFRGKRENTTGLPKHCESCQWKGKRAADKMYQVFVPQWRTSSDQLRKEGPRSCPCQKNWKKPKNPPQINRSKQLILFSHHHHELVASSATMWTSGAKFFVVCMEAQELPGDKPHLFSSIKEVLKGWFFLHIIEL